MTSSESILSELTAAVVDMENVFRHLAEANRLIVASPAWRVQLPKGLTESLEIANRLLDRTNNDRAYMQSMIPAAEEAEPRREPLTAPNALYEVGEEPWEE